jgi:hypothetical protein
MAFLARNTHSRNAKGNLYCRFDYLVGRQAFEAELTHGYRKILVGLVIGTDKKQGFGERRLSCLAVRACSASISDQTLFADTKFVELARSRLCIGNSLDAYRQLKSGAFVQLARAPL